MITDSIGTIAQRIVVTLGFVVWIFCAKHLRKGPISWLLIAAILVPLISWGAAHLTHPQWAESSPKVHRLTSWFMFIPIFVWLGGRERNVLILWVVALCGLLAAPWISGGGWGEISRGFSGYRVDFDLHNAQHAGMLFAVALLGIVAFSKRFIFKQDCISWIGACLWSLLVIYCSSGVLITQTRGIWLGLIGALMTMSLVALFLLIRHRFKFFTFKKVIFLILLVSVSLSILPYTSITDIIEKRLSRESDYILKIVGLNDEENVGVTSSVGARVTTWIEGVKWAKERPIIGWGGNGRRIVILNSETLPQQMKSFGHFHNSYLDALVMFGLLGFVLYLLLLLFFISNVCCSYLNQNLSLDFFLFFIAFLTFWLVVNMFESYMFFSSGTFVFSLIFGGMMTLHLREKGFS